jgi:hypothetical protein
VRELRPGLWHWEAPHPEWSPGEPWDPVVSSYATDAGKRLLLFDPMIPPSEIDALVADRETAVVLTCPWHERATQNLVERNFRSGRPRARALLTDDPSRKAGRNGYQPTLARLTSLAGPVGRDAAGPRRARRW